MLNLKLKKMNSKKFLILGIIGVFVVLGIVYFSMSVSYSNEEVELRTAISKKQKLNEAAFDNMWKIIQQKAKVANKYQEDFKDVYKTIMDSRYQNGGNGQGALFSFLKESNPNLDVSLYKEISRSIEAERNKFYDRQEQLSALSEQHTNLISTFPGTWFLSDREEIEIVIVTSTKAEETFKTGKDDDIELFE
jgi:hemerythrin superfamily protein